MTKKEYLSLIRCADAKIELVGIQRSINVDPNLLPADRTELEKALSIKERWIAEEE